MTIPNFFIVGAAKSGTTSLYHQLDQHPAIFMSPIKEPCFFAPEVAEYTEASREFVKADAAALRAYLDGPLTAKRDRGIVLAWDDYLTLFRNANGARAVGEASVSYLSSSAAAENIYARASQARILALLRDPAARLFSQYSESVASAHTKLAFMAWVEQNRALEVERNPTFGPVWTSHYAPQLSRYLARFRRERIAVEIHDDYARHPAAILKRIFTFLEVDPAQPINLVDRHNVTRVPLSPAAHHGVLRPIGRAVKQLIGAKAGDRLAAWWFSGNVPRMTRGERGALIQMFEPDIDAVET
ncbi:MAG TPA: sulfotransferase, partial [Vicinamibacterales bacterium]|nr:sulfotransferase [Vicinamibacterales bacterium]